jgi:pimeloyl-ACP methyl ester carboxylesterase
MTLGANTMWTQSNVHEAQWQSLPPTPSLPESEESGLAKINGVSIWYAVFGEGEPVFLLHGGLANSNYWGHQVPVLAKQYSVVVMDTRGHGRSSSNNEPFTYNLIASDVVALMDLLRIKKAAVIGWSDGANVGLDMAINNPERLAKLFAFAGNTDPSGVKDVSNSNVFNSYLARVENEYATLSPTPHEFEVFQQNIVKMWSTLPHFTAETLNRIASPVWIVDGDHDEAIKRENTLFMADHIPGAGLLIQPAASHFSFLQDPTQFNEHALHFLVI